MKRFSTLAAVLPLAAAGAALVWYWRSGPPLAPLADVPLTALPGFATQPSLAPDGRQVAFAWNGEKEDNFDIYVQSIPAGAPVRLTSDSRREVSPAWSPDGTRIAFLRMLGGGRAALMLMPAGGGAETKVAEIATPLPDDPGAPDLAQMGPFLSWRPDGRALLTHDRERTQGPYAIVQVSLATGEKRGLTSPRRGLGDLEAAFAPDGRSIAFTRYTAPGRGNIYRLELTPGAEPRLLMTTNVWSFGPCWTAGGREVLFSPSAAGPSGIWRIGLFRSSRQRPVAVSADAALVSPAAAAGRLVYAKIERAVSVSVGPASAGPGSSPAFSPDGRRIAFIRRGVLWLADADGSHAAPLATGAGPAVSGPRWSPDGKLLVFASNPERFWDIFTAPVDGGEPRQLTARPGNHFSPGWSPDGSRIYYVTSLAGSDDEIWRVTPAGTDATRVTRGAQAAVSPDARFLYFAKTPVARELWRLTLGGGAEQKVVETGEPFSEFAVTASGVYLAGSMLWPQRTGSIRFFDFATRGLREIERTPQPLYRGLDISRDGRLAFTQVDRVTAGLRLVEGFR